MSIISRCRVHDAVYWPPIANSALDGVKAGPPVQIKCRWDEETEEITDERGDKYVSNSQVICDRLVENGGYLFHGTIADLNGQTDVTGVEAAKPIRKVLVATKIKNNDWTDFDKTLVIAYL